ncbi:MAG: type II secretion system protein [Minisyncoccia bacterium]
MKMNLKKGFTLIELLVVVAIIGILASVVLASLNSARAKGADAAVKANLANMRAQAELIYDTVETPTDSVGYDGVCANTNILAALAAAGQASGGATFCLDSTSAWAAAVPLKTVPAQSWCVDSTGASKERTGNTATTAC